MRSTRDRVRHAISFEIIGLLLIIPLGSVAFGLPLHDIGVVGIGSSLVATGWTYVYNLGFDHAMVRFSGSTRKTLAIRVAHAVLFEIGLLAALMPLIAWYLGISLWQAFIMDAAIAVFYVLYAFVFNWSYDRVFPDPGAVRA